MKRVLMPLAQEGFDPTEAGVSWKMLRNAGIQVSFATPTGAPGRADPRMLEGHGLGIWKPFLSANSEGREAYLEMESDPNFQKPHAYKGLLAVGIKAFDGLILPGGHDKPMRAYLESQELQSFVADFMDAEKPVGAICHGVVLAARSTSKKTGKSVLHELRTTSLTKSQEILAYKLTRFWLGDYYLTYPITVEDEVKSVLKNSQQYSRGPLSILRDSEKSLSRGYVVKDGNYISARWPGDAHRFGTEFAALVNS